MSLFITSLNSGSNGNCYYIGNENEGILIDAGLSCRETEKRLKRLGIECGKIKAIFITHEHTDHINGLYQLVKKHGWPVYITPLTLLHSRLDLSLQMVRTFQAHQPITIGQLVVTAFPKFHDAADPHSIVISSQSVRVGVFTDIGVVCPQVISYFKTCHAVFLESNYEEELLENGPYPFYLKRRIKGGKGHISNAQAFRLFVEHRPPFLTHLFLSHLSHHNNDPQLVHRIFSTVAGKTEIIIASRAEETEVYHIDGKASIAPIMSATMVKQVVDSRKTRKLVANPGQLSLF